MLRLHRRNRPSGLPGWIEYTPKVPTSASIKPCRLCGGSPNLDFYRPQGFMVYCSKCYFVMNSREGTEEQAIAVWDANN